MDWFHMTLGVLGGLGVFLYGMRVMSRGLESVGGDKMRSLLQGLTSHPLSAIFTGFTVTCVIQSSSATTVMLVGLVHAGFLQLNQAIGVILGANIGTTITGWIVATLGFKVKISAFALPAVALGVMLLFSSESGRKRALWGEILVGFGLLFLGLMFMKNSVGTLKGSGQVNHLLGSFSASKSFASLVFSIGIGTIVTVVIQSSSATMALTIALAHKGLIDFPTASALILGENIGTTITANLASIGAGVLAKRAARAHFIFNSLGVLWAVILFYPLLNLVNWMLPGDPWSDSRVIGEHMAAFHTVFNTVNTSIFFFFIPFLSKSATKLVPDKTERDGAAPIVYLDQWISSTPQLAMLAARKELHRMLTHSIGMIDKVMELFKNSDKPLSSLVKQIKDEEEIVDALEQEITCFLTKVSKNELSTEASQEISSSINIAHNIERIGDYGEALLRLINRKYDGQLVFSEEAMGQIVRLSDNVGDLLSLIEENILDFEDVLDEATPLEETIDRLRGDFRDLHIKRLVSGECDVIAGLVYVDLLTTFEKIGDQAYAIAQYISKAKKK